MSRTPGAKNNPPDPQKELEKVRKLFADKGLPFPGDSAESKTGDESEDQEGLHITTGDNNGGDGDDGKDDEDGFECGACHSELDSAVASCPHCGAKLNWSS